MSATKENPRPNAQFITSQAADAASMELHYALAVVELARYHVEADRYVSAAERLADQTGSRRVEAYIPGELDEHALPGALYAAYEAIKKAKAVLDGTSPGSRPGDEGGAHG